MKFHDVVTKLHHVVTKFHHVVTNLHDVVSTENFSHDVVMKFHDVSILLYTFVLFQVERVLHLLSTAWRVHAP